MNQKHSQFLCSATGRDFVADNSFMLEHFYRGQLVKAGAPDGEPRLLASTAGVKPEQVAEAVQLALIPPLTESPTGSLALVRGKSGVFFFVQAFVGSARQYMAHVVLLPSELIRTISGNLTALLPLVQREMPAYESAGAMLPLLALPTAEPAPPDHQSKTMLALMSACRDRIQTIETLLAAVITGVPLVIQGAPPELDKRISMIEGMMALLPPPARPGVTFATHTLPPRRPDAAITFYPDGDTPDGAMVYRWGETAPTGAKASDDYARFIASQLRLDTSLVLEQTAALTPVAGWRIRRGDQLNEALHYAAMRLKIDNAVQTNQPVELNDAAEILSEDPTLTDELRLAYVNHLLKLALPLGEFSHLRTLGRIARGNKPLEEVLLKQIEEALTAGTHTGAIFRALLDWLNIGGGFEGMLWAEQTQRAAKLNADALVKAGDTAGLATFLDEVATAPPTAEVGVVLPHLIEKSLPLAPKDAALAREVITLAAAAYPADKLLRLLTERDLVAQLPAAAGRLQPFFFGVGRGETATLLANAAGAFGDDGRELMAIRFAELALLQDKPALIDSSALEQLAQAAEHAWGEPFDQTLRWIVRNMSGELQMKAIGEPGASSLVRILLARRAYKEFAATLIASGSVLFNGDDAQIRLGEFTRAIFAQTTLEPVHATNALKALVVAGMKPLPMMNAYYGALQAGEWAAPLNGLAADLNVLVQNNPMLAAQAPLPMLLALVQYHRKRADTPSAIRVAEMMPSIVVREGEDGVMTMLRLCSLLRDDEALRNVAVNLLRRYVRHLPMGDDRRAAARLSEKLGPKVKAALEATLFVRRVFDGLPIDEYAHFLHIAAQFLYDTASAYVEKERFPGIKILMSDLDSLNGGLNSEQRRALGHEILDLGKAIVTIAARQKAQRPRQSEQQLQALVEGDADALAPLDVLRVLGGYFARGKRLPKRLTQSLNGHPLAARSAADVLAHTEITLRLLRAFAKAFPGEGKWKISGDALWTELESLWEEVSLPERRRLVQDLAVDFQRLPDLLLFIAEQGTARTLQDDDRNARKLDLGEKKPENTLELYRMISSYFRARAR
jgi:hypothetical protein